MINLGEVECLNNCLINDSNIDEQPQQTAKEHTPEELFGMFSKVLGEFFESFVLIVDDPEDAGLLVSDNVGDRESVEVVERVLRLLKEFP
jgi:hypothetical protein